MALVNVDQEYGNEPDAETRDLFQKLFIAALLLTGSEAKAELSILEGIGAFDGKASSNALLHATLSAAIASRDTIHREISGAQDLSTSRLPVELRHVLLLPENLRHCFVLRLLVGLPLRECSRLLLLEPCQVEENTISAAVELAAIRTGRLPHLTFFGAQTWPPYHPAPGELNNPQSKEETT